MDKENLNTIRKSVKKIIIDYSRSKSLDSVQETLTSAGLDNDHAKILSDAILSFFNEHQDVDVVYKTISERGIPDNVSNMIMFGFTAGLRDISFQPKANSTNKKGCFVTAILFIGVSYFVMKSLNF